MIGFYLERVGRREQSIQSSSGGLFKVNWEIE